MSDRPSSRRNSDRRATLDHDFIKGHEYEVVVRAIGPDGTEQPMEGAARAIIQIVGKIEPPSAPEDLAADGYLNAITLTWVNPADYDVAGIEVWRANTDDIGAAAKIADVTGITYIDAFGLPNVTRYYFIRAINTSGEYSDFTESATGTSLGVTASDIDDFAVTATKTFLNTVVLTGDSWTNNSPGAGSIAWNIHFLTWNGKYYEIAAGNTSNRYVTFDGEQAPGSGSGTVDDPFEAVYSGDAAWTAADNKFNIATNESGTFQAVWNSSANMVIGSAFILDAAIITAKINNLAVTTGKIANLNVTTAKIANLNVTNAKINDLNVDKLTAGTIESKAIILAVDPGQGDVYIAAGKTDFTNVDSGFILGIDDSDSDKAKFYIGDADKFLNWDGAALTVQGTIQTAGSGQRIVIDSSNNTMKFYDSLNDLKITIDDNVLFGLPGIQMDNGIIWLESSTFGDTHIFAGEISVGTPDATGALAARSTGTAAADIFSLLYTASGFTGNFCKFRDHNLATVFLIDKSGNITTVGTVDGVDVAAVGGLAHARAHTMSSTADHTSVATYRTFYSDINKEIVELALGATNSVLQGVGGTSMAFAALNHSQVANKGVNDHHAQVHNLNSHSDVSGSNGDFLLYDSGGWTTPNFITAVQNIIDAYLGTPGYDGTFDGGDIPVVVNGLIRSAN